MSKTSIGRLLAVAFACGLGAGTASATVINHTGSFDGPGNHLYQLFGQIGAASLDTPAEVDAGQLPNDAYWQIAGGAGGSLATMVFEISANSGSTLFGIFDAANTNNIVQLWNGSAIPGPGNGGTVAVSISTDGSVFVNFVDTLVNFGGNQFGFYIQVGSTRFYSDSALNGNSSDQMVAFQCAQTDVVTLPGFAPGNCSAGEYFLGFEDILTRTAAGGLNGDYDYNDLVVAVESVNRVPEPATLVLLGLGLVGLGAVRRRRPAV